jgi:hypothetical protein
LRASGFFGGSFISIPLARFACNDSFCEELICFCRPWCPVGFSRLSIGFASLLGASLDISSYVPEGEIFPRAGENRISYRLGRQRDQDVNAVSGSNFDPDIQAVLDVLHEGMQGGLRGRLVGLYVLGSLAGGDFDRETSDIDFAAVTNGPLSEGEIAGLAAMHAWIVGSGLPWAAKLEGTYLPREVIRRYAPSDALYPSLNEGRFYMGTHGSHWVIQCHLLREDGIALEGPPARNLVDPIAPEQLRKATRDLLREWWAPKLEDATRLATAEYQAYSVLTMCRVLYTLQTGQIATKPVAARWAQAELGGPLGELVERAVSWRPGMPFDALDETREIIRLALERSKA